MSTYSCPQTGEVDSEKVLAGERWCPKPKMSDGSRPVTEGIGNRLVSLFVNTCVCVGKAHDFLSHVLMSISVFDVHIDASTCTMQKFAMHA